MNLDDDKLEISKWKKKKHQKMLWKYYKIGKWEVVRDKASEEDLYVLRKYYGADV